MSKPETSATSGRHDVVVVGGGPVGLFLGMSLAAKGVDTLVLEAEADINPSPRALMYYPIVLNEFKKLGILDDVVAVGYKNEEGLTFRTLATGTNQVLARIPPGGRAPPGVINYGVQLGQPQLAAIFRKHAARYAHLRIRYGVRCVALHQDEDGVTVEAEAGAAREPLTLRARFVAGCDGASSRVRKALDIPFEGYTWEDWRFLAVNIRYDFAAHGYPAANHVIDPEDWAVVVRASNEREGLWRIATGIDPSIPVDEIEKHLPAKLEKILPGPRPLQYEVVACSPYWAHERVAASFRSGRVVLCGDAAHVNNPLTALGLTTGLVDAAALARLLPQAFAADARPDAWQALLARYAEVRRHDFVRRVQKQTVEGKLRIHSTDPKVAAARDDFFNMLNKNPGFGRFVAGTMTEVLPDDLTSPSPLKYVAATLLSGLKTVQIIAMIIFWKIRAAVL